MLMELIDAISPPDDKFAALLRSFRDNATYP